MLRQRRCHRLPPNRRQVAVVLLLLSSFFPSWQLRQHHLPLHVETCMRLHTYRTQTSEKDDKSLFIPKGFAHGYGVLSSEATVVYLQSGNFEPSLDFSINPLSLNIKWGIDTPLLSDKDKNAISFDEFINI